MDITQDVLRLYGSPRLCLYGVVLLLQYEFYLLTFRLQLDLLQTKLYIADLVYERGGFSVNHILFIITLNLDEYRLILLLIRSILFYSKQLSQHRPKQVHNTLPWPLLNDYLSMVLIFLVYIHFLISFLYMFDSFSLG